MLRAPTLLAFAVATSLALSSRAAPPATSPMWTGRIAAPIAPIATDAHTSARRALHELGLAAAKAELAPAGVTTLGDGDRFVNFTQRHLGLDVLGAGATVRMTARGEVTLVTQHLGRALPASAKPTLSLQEAARRAEKYTGLGASFKGARLVFLAVDEDDVRLVYVLRMSSRFPQLISPQVTIDAGTGEVLEARDLAVRAKANMYASNPVKSSVALRELAIAPVGGRLVSEVLETSNCVDEKRVASVDFGTGSPTAVHVCSLTRKALANAEGDFVYTPTDDAANPARDSDEFSEVSMYYHATRAYAFFRGLRGDATAQVVNDKPLRTISNLRVPAGIMRGNFSTIGDPEIPLEPFQNAFFSPGGPGDPFGSIYSFEGGAMWFGQGPRHDYAYDGDVVYHEFTHAVVDATIQLQSWVRDSQGAIDAPGAMNEGLADYFSSAISGDPDVGEYASKDADPSLTVIRTLANTDACPAMLGGEVHFDSTFWSGGLWSARMAVGEADREAFDRSVYKAMMANPGRGGVTFEELTGLIGAVLETDLPQGKTALENAMRVRGAFPSCDRTLTFTGRPIDGPRDLGGVFMAPGREDLPSFRPVAPGIMTFRYDLPARTTEVRARFTVPSSGGGSPFGGGTPFTPVVFGRFDGRIEWTKTGSNLVATGSTQVAPTKQGGTYTATFSPPAGATAIYVQIANSGQSSGMYQGVHFLVTTSDPLPPTEVDAGADASLETPRLDRVAGCTCAVAGASQGPTRGLGGPLASLLGLVGLVLGRRRQRAPRA